MNPLILFAIVLLSAGVSVIPWSKQSTPHRLSLAMSALTTIVSSTLLALFWMGAPAPVSDLWLLDRLSSFMLGLITLISFAASIVSYRYLRQEEQEGIVSQKQVRLYYTCLHLFVLAMMVTVLSNNILLLWIGLESTTLATTMLVAFYVKDAAIEAAWKYILLCSTGIAIGLVGLLLFLHAAATIGLELPQLLLFTQLSSQAGHFLPSTVQWAFVFIFVGIGTKVGLAPMHTWLPDAHSKTPAPISAMLSGVLLNVALYTILRFKSVTDISLGSGNWTDHFFLIFGFLSVLIPSCILLIQGNYKRMLAYSSVEHMGLISFFVGLGPLGAPIALLHMIGHSLLKPLLFFGAGEIVLAHKSTKIEKIHNLIQAAPVTSILFLLGILGIAGVPPSPLFFSEFLGLSLGISRYPLLTAIVLLCLALVLIGMIRATFAMLFSVSDEKNFPHSARGWNITHMVMVSLLVLATGASIWILLPSGQDQLTNLATFFTPNPHP